MESQFKVSAIEVIGKNKRKSKYMKVNSESIFTAKTPGQAASKAFTKFCKLNKKKLDECKVSVAMENIETGKIKTYQLERIYDPFVITKGGTEIKFNYRVIKKSI